MMADILRMEIGNLKYAVALVSSQQWTRRQFCIAPFVSVQRFGGIYVDVDTTALRSFGPIFHK